MRTAAIGRADHGELLREMDPRREALALTPRRKGPDWLPPVKRKPRKPATVQADA